MNIEAHKDRILKALRTYRGRRLPLADEDRAWADIKAAVAGAEEFRHGWRRKSAADRRKHYQALAGRLEAAADDMRALFDDPYLLEPMGVETGDDDPSLVLTDWDEARDDVNRMARLLDDMHGNIVAATKRASATVRVRHGRQPTWDRPALDGLIWRLGLIYQQQRPAHGELRIITKPPDGQSYFERFVAAALAVFDPPLDAGTPRGVKEAIKRFKRSCFMGWPNVQAFNEWYSGKIEAAKNFYTAV